MAAAWNEAELAEEGMRRRTGGANLLRHLQLLYAERKLTAKDFAIACHFCVESEVRGADFAPFAVPPEQATGNYQKAIDRAILPFDRLYLVPTPPDREGKPPSSCDRFAHELSARGDRPRSSGGPIHC